MSEGRPSTSVSSTSSSPLTDVLRPVLPLTTTLYCSWLGLGGSVRSYRIAGSRASGSTSSPTAISCGSHSLSPRYLRRISPQRACCGSEQCISSERITGYGEMPRQRSSPRRTILSPSPSISIRCGNEYSEMARTTSSNMTWRPRKSLAVRPCLIVGSPSRPSQQSSSRQRPPISSTRSYISTDEYDLSWSPVR